MAAPSGAPLLTSIIATMAFLEARNLSKTYRNAEVPVPVFDALDLSVERGEMLAIVGPSGIGKSTLLHLLGGLDRPDSGTIRVGDREVTVDVATTSWRASGTATSDSSFSSIICCPSSRR